MTSAKAWGIEARLLTPAEIKELVPFINDDDPARRLLHAERVGGRLAADRHADARGGGRQRRAAGVRQHRGARHRGRSTAPGRAPSSPTRAASRPSTWRSRAACGARASRRWPARRSRSRPRCTRWPTSGRSTCSQQTGKEVAYPIIRDMDTFCYERQSAGSMEVGSYAHRPIFHHPDDIPSNEESALSPTELPFTADDFDQQLEEAIELMGEILGTAEIRYAINGLLSLTPDAMPVLGETVEVRNLWSAAAVWIKEGPGIAQLVAEWMTYGYPHLCDPHPATSAASTRTSAPSTTSTPAAPSTSTRPTASSTRASSGRASGACGAARSTRARRRSGAVFFDARGWERPQWYESQRRRCSSSYPAGCEPRAARVGRALVVADHQRRAPARCATASAWSTSRRSTSSTSRARARSPCLQYIVRQQRRRAGRPLGVHAAAHAATAASAATSRSSASATSTSASSPARSTAGATSTGSAGTCRPTAR